MMKSVGIVRKFDDLGRLVIPKELRRVLDLGVNCPMEFFQQDDSIVIKRYSPLRDMTSISRLVQSCATALFSKTGLACIITDDREIVAVAGVPKALKGSKVGVQLRSVIETHILPEELELPLAITSEFVARSATVRVIKVPGHTGYDGLVILFPVNRKEDGFSTLAADASCQLDLIRDLISNELSEADL